MPYTNNRGIISRKPFDLQEAVVLLNVYLSAKKKGLTQAKMAEIASQRLRALAKNRGFSIDESFRSPTGLQNRLRSIGNIYEGHESSSAPGTQMFRDAVALYKNDRREYQHLLDAAAVTNIDVPSGKAKKRMINKTKFVRTRKDQTLKEQYGDAFSDVYYTLKSGTKKNTSGITATEVFVALDRSIKQKDIALILDGASWSKSVSDTRYLFFDKEQKERKQKQMKESLKKTEKDFFAWLPSAVAPSAIEDVKNSYVTVNAMLVQRNILPQSLIATTQIGQVENALRLSKKVLVEKKLRNNAVKLLSAYIAYLREKKNSAQVKSKPEIDINEDWIRFDFSNTREFERTVPTYCLVAGKEFVGKTWGSIIEQLSEYEIARNNAAINSLYNEPLIGRNIEVPFFMKSKIDENHNCKQLSNGYWINLHYSTPQLMKIIKMFCLHCGYNKSQVVIYGVPKEKHTVSPNKATDPKPSSGGVPFEKAELFLKKADLNGATVQQLIDAVQPGAAVYPTKVALDASINVVAMPGNRYVHVEAFVDLDEAEDAMRRILKTHFAQFSGYSNSKLLFGAAAHDLSMFLNDNDCEDVDSVYALAQFFFDKKSTAERFTFSNPHIFEKAPDYPLTLKGLMINFSRANDGVLSTENAKNYLQKTMLSYGSLNQLLAISTSDTFLLYDDARYLLAEKLGISKEWKKTIHDKLDNLFRQANVAYIIPRDISHTWLNTLPVLPHGLNWTTLLLQDVLKKFPDIGFRPITAELNQSIDTIAAAIVPTDSPLQSFSDIVTLFMKERHVLPLRMACEELRVELRDAGMLEGGEMIYALPKALDDYRFSWTDENKTVLVRGD